MSFISRVKNRCSSPAVRATFRNEEGAFDLSSVMVGIAVLGVLTGVVSATVFGVIPWTQDKEAQRQLSTVVIAQKTFKGMNDGVYTDNLTGILDDQIKGVTVRSNNDDCFGSFITSATGNTFYLSSVSSTPTKIPNGAAWPTAKPSDYPAGCIWPVSRASAAVSSVKNYILNPSFESNAANVAGIGNAGKTFTTGVSPTAHSGSSVLRLTRTNTTSNYGIGVGFVSANVEPGTYIASWRMRSDKPFSFLSYSGENTPGGTTPAIKTISGQTGATTLTPEWQTFYAKYVVTQAGALKPGVLQNVTSSPAIAVGDVVEFDSVQLIKATGDDTSDKIYEQ